MTARPAWLHVFLDTPTEAFEEALDFWVSVTGWQPSVRRGEDGQFLTLVPRRGAAYVKMQAVAGAAGVHLDLDSADRPALVERSRALGATTAWTYHDVEVMRSPGGFVFCHTLVGGEPVLVRDRPTIADQVCLDVPSALWDDEVAFWAGLTGRTPEPGALPEFTRLVEPGHPRIPLQRTRERLGTVRGHLDLASADRTVDTITHVALGAVVLAVRDHWTVLRAPGGHVYCLTDRDPRSGGTRPV